MRLAREQVSLPQSVEDRDRDQHDGTEQRTGDVERAPRAACAEGRGWGQRVHQRIISSMADILIIEDDADIASGLRENLELEGHTVRVAPAGMVGLARAHERRPDLVLL